MRRLIGLVALALVAGCASIPSSGPVTEVVDDTGLGQSTVRYSPALPADGAAPADIVRGYLDAMLAYPASTRTAAAFLTPAAARDWKPQAGVTVYSDAQAVVLGDRQLSSGDEAVDERTVPVTLDESGRLDVRGAYVAGRGGRTQTYHLTLVEGEWRITDPQAGLLVTDKFFADYFRPFNLYFFDTGAERLVASPVHLPVDDRLAAALVSGLARGPGGSGLRTFVPAVDSLRPTVPVDGGIAEVGFTESPDTEESDAEVDRLSAQVVRTLRQVPGLEGVRIGLGPDTLAPTGASVQPVTAWQEFDAGVRDRGFALAGGRVVQVVDDDVSVIAGPWGRDARGASGVALAGDSIAVLRRGRSEVGIGPRTGAATLEVSGQSFLDPIADTSGRFWLVDRPDGRVRIRVVAGDEVRTVSTTAVGRRDLQALDVSPDGARLVLTTGAGRAARVLVAPVVRDEKDVEIAIGKPAEVPVGLVAPRSAVWSDAVRLAFLAGDGTPQVHTALIDGSVTTAGGTGGRAVLPDVDGVRLAVGGGSDPDIYVTARDGRLWHLGISGSWRLVEVERVTSVGFGS